MNNVMNVAFNRKNPVWTSENTVSLETPAFILRKFKSGTGRAILCLPPQAGHSSHIADYDNGQSLMETARKNMYPDDSLWCIEWKSCTYARKGEGIKDLVAQVIEAINFIGCPVTLLGLCQGGWLASIVAALYTELVIGLILIGAPIDFHKGGGALYDMVTGTGILPYRWMVLVSGGLMSGAAMLAGWKLMNPIDRFMTDYIDIMEARDDDEKLRKIAKFRDWYEYTQDLAGNWYLDAVENLFIENKLIKGELIVDGQRVDLSNIECPVVLIAGELDDITLVPQLFAMKDAVSSQIVHTIVIPECGHIGCFMGRKSQAYLVKAMQWWRTRV